MSPHIASRWYRAPESILLEKDYEFGVDIWAVGCTFAELAVCSKPYLKYVTKKSQKLGSDLGWTGVTDPDTVKGAFHLLVVLSTI
jgi:serine/threonine protein kinase